MSNPKHPLFQDFSGKKSKETWSATSVYQKIQEVVEDFEKGRIKEADLAQFLNELQEKDSEHFLDKMDEYNEELRLRLQRIEIAKQALKVAGIISDVRETLENTPGMDEAKKSALDKSLNAKLVGIKDPGDANQVSDGISKAINTLSSQEGIETEKLQAHIDSMKEIAMGLKVDYLGSTRQSLGTGTVLQGPLGEVLSLGFSKLHVEADNDGAKYISGYITTQRNDLAIAIQSTANYVKNRPQI